MITDFKGFGPVHIISILIPLIVCTSLIFWGVKTNADAERRKIRYILAALVVLVRGARYGMDVYFGVFDWFDLFSLHICHIDLIVLTICLIRPSRALFSFCFLIGIPAALSVVLFPGSNHPAPGLPRALFFIMSHMMLIMGAVYLAVVERLKPSLKAYLWVAGIGNVGLLIVYLVNKQLGTNFLYIMRAPEGTVIVSLDKIFGWPGYVFAIDLLALSLMLLMYFIGQLIRRPAKREDSAAPSVLP